MYKEKTFKRTKTELLSKSDLLLDNVLLQFLDFMVTRTFALSFDVAGNFIQATGDIAQLVIKLVTHLECNFKLCTTHLSAALDVIKTLP